MLAVQSPFADGTTPFPAGAAAARAGKPLAVSTPGGEGRDRHGARSARPGDATVEAAVRESLHVGAAARGTVQAAQAQGGEVRWGRPRGAQNSGKG